MRQSVTTNFVFGECKLEGESLNIRISIGVAVLFLAIACMDRFCNFHVHVLAFMKMEAHASHDEE